MTKNDTEFKLRVVKNYLAGGGGARYRLLTEQEPGGTLGYGPNSYGEGRSNPAFVNHRWRSTVSPITTHRMTIRSRSRGCSSD